MSGWLGIVVLDAGVLLLLYVAGCAAELPARRVPARQEPPKVTDPGREAVQAARAQGWTVPPASPPDDPAGRHRKPSIMQEN